DGDGVMDVYHVKRVLLAFFRVCYYRCPPGCQAPARATLLHGAWVEQDVVAARRGSQMLEFNDLKPLHAELAQELKAALERVLESGWFILGPEVEAFEQEFASYHGVRHAIAVASGTDAIELALRVAGIGPGDEVITVAHTAVATVCAIERTGARPVLVDIDPG